MKDGNEMTKAEEVEKAEEFDTNISVEHAFFALWASMMTEPFMSGDLKVIIVHKAYGFLEKMGYSKEEVEAFRKKMDKMTDVSITRNDFMG